MADRYCVLSFFFPTNSYASTTSEPVKDYRTHVSGITLELLENGVSFQEAQDAVCQIIYSDTIVVGHSLNNDLNVLKIQHWHIIDTSMLYMVPSLGHRTFSLKVGKEEKG